MNLELRAASLIAAFGLSAAACSSSSTAATTLPHPTVIEVAPADFLGALECKEGGMRRYVATLTDVSPGPGDAPLNFTLPSSALQIDSSDATSESIRYEPVPCSDSVEFGLVVTGHYYWAKIDGYDRDDLEMLEPGLPIVVDAKTRARVLPRWTTTCSKADSSTDMSDAGAKLVGVRAELDLTQPVTGCLPWSESTP